MKLPFSDKAMFWALVIVMVAVCVAITTGMFPNCPDAPVAVDTVYVGDHVDWLYYEKALEITAENELYADSIATLNAALVELLKDKEDGDAPTP